MGVGEHDVGRVGLRQHRAQLEGELLRVFVGVDVAGRLRLGDELDHQPVPPGLEVRDPRPHPARMGVQLGGCGREEAAAGKRVAADVYDKPFQQLGEAGDGPVPGERRPGHLGIEDGGRGVDRRQL